MVQAVNRSVYGFRRRVAIISNPRLWVGIEKNKEIDLSSGLHLHHTWEGHSQQGLKSFTVDRALGNKAAARETLVGGEGANGWRSNWLAFLHRLHADGFFTADPHLRVEDIHSGNQPAIKRAILNFSRHQPNILSQLDISIIKKLVEAGKSHADADRKTRNAYKRLEASFLRGQSLPESDGGSGDLQDLLRLVFALEIASANDPSYNHGALADAADGFLIDVLRVFRP